MPNINKTNKRREGSIHKILRKSWRNISEDIKKLYKTINKGGIEHGQEIKRYKGKKNRLH